MLSVGPVISALEFKENWSRSLQVCQAVATLHLSISSHVSSAVGSLVLLHQSTSLDPRCAWPKWCQAKWCCLGG